jgi:hypothetical protein
VEGGLFVCSSCCCLSSLRCFLQQTTSSLSVLMFSLCNFQSSATNRQGFEVYAVDSSPCLCVYMCLHVSVCVCIVQKRFIRRAARAVRSTITARSFSFFAFVVLRVLPCLQRTWLQCRRGERASPSLPSPTTVGVEERGWGRRKGGGLRTALRCGPLFL